MTVDKLLVSEAELRKMSSLQNPNKILGVFNIPEPLSPDFSDWALVLDTVQDPGNLGTIIRLADWFGIRHIICSENTVDCYNPKTLQATMGSIGRVNIVYTDLQELFSQVKKPVYGAFLDGHSIYDEAFPASGLLVLGNEANGISDELSSVITNRITIPQYGARSTESLNVAMATAILLNEVRRPIQK